MVSSLITGAVAILLLLLGGYVIASGILTISESTMNSQIEMGTIQESVRQSSIAIKSATVGKDGSAWWLVLDLINTGSTTFGGRDFSHMDLYVYDDYSTPKTMAKYNSPTFHYEIINDLVNRNMWDPSETLKIHINNTIIPNWTKVVTPNGITASTNL